MLLKLIILKLINFTFFHAFLHLSTFVVFGDLTLTFSCYAEYESSFDNLMKSFHILSLALGCIFSPTRNQLEQTHPCSV